MRVSSSRGEPKRPREQLRFLAAVRQELVQRRIEQADGDRVTRPSPRRSPRSRRAAWAAAWRARAAVRLHRARRSSRASRECGRPRRTCARCDRARCPSAPNSRATRASFGVSAFARTLRRRTSSAQLRTRENDWYTGARAARSAPLVTRTTSLGIVGRSPTKTRPVAPSSVIQSPSRHHRAVRR